MWALVFQEERGLIAATRGKAGEPRGRWGLSAPLQGFGRVDADVITQLLPQRAHCRGVCGGQHHRRALGQLPALKAPGCACADRLASPRGFQGAPIYRFWSGGIRERRISCVCSALGLYQSIALDPEAPI